MQTVGTYELLEKIAEGGMGAVYKARNPATGETVAIKIVPPHLARNQVLLKRFQQEYNAARTLDHPNIVRALDFGFTGESPYLVMEFVEGESLGDLLERRGRLDEGEAIRLITQVAQALQKAHKEGMVHRDVKPDNILINRDGQAKLADLGLVKEMETDLNLTRTGRGLGTPHFMSPEQFRNAKNADERCDIYSLGATLYMMVTGELPFKSLGPLEAWMKKIENKIAPARELVPALSERVDWAIRRSMAAEPSQRPASCREFIEDLTGQSTKRITPLVPEGDKETWFLRYKDDEGVIHTVKGTAPSVRRSLKDGVLGDAGNIRAAKNKSGPFEPLRNHPEFRDLVVARTDGGPRPAPAASRGDHLRPATGTAALPPARAAAVAPASKVLSKPANVATSAPRADEAKPAAADATPAPHIDLGASDSQGEWGKVLLVMLIAMGVGVIGFFLLPLLTR